MEIGATKAVQDRLKPQRLQKAKVFHLCSAGTHI
jgi:hypothetical protein